MAESGLLPASIEQFATISFWESFFQARGGAAFEWYCEYEQLAPLLENAALRSPYDSVLHAGCGNSNLCFELVQRSKFDYVVNADFSELAVKEMAQKAASLELDTRSKLDFITLDCLNIPFKDESFSWVLDKGLHDAMMKDSEEDCRVRSNKLFSEFARILRAGGKFVMVSLGQTHIIDLLELAIGSSLWGAVHVTSLVEVTSPLLPFIFVFDKATAASSGEVELSINGAKQPISSFRSLLTAAQRQYSQAAATKKFSVSKQRQIYLVTVDFKPWEAGSDFSALETAIRSSQLPHVTWLQEPSSVLPIAYGVCKLRMRCLVDTSARDVDSVVTDLEEVVDEDFVQSIDVASSTPLRS